MACGYLPACWHGMVSPPPCEGCLRRRQRRRNMLVNQLAFVVVLGMQPPIRPGDRLRRLIGLEAQVELLVLRGLGGVAHPLVTEHQVVVGLQVFGIDRQSPAAVARSPRDTCATGNSTRPRSLRTTRSLGYCSITFCKLLRRAVVIAVGTQHARIEIVRPRQIRD